MEKIELNATIENYITLSNWFHNIAVDWNLSNALINKIDVCLEEIFVNISSYAYIDKVGMAKISINKDNENTELTLKFEDEGIKYNPLLKDDPDITLSYKERPIGGLGIFMVKELASEVKYEQIDNKNLLTLKFSID